MSADLFAAFGSSSAPQNEQKPTGPDASVASDPFGFLSNSGGPFGTTQAAAPVTNTASRGQGYNPDFQANPAIGGPVVEDEDGWGDFEVAAPIVAAPPTPSQASSTAPGPATGPSHISPAVSHSVSGLSFGSQPPFQARPPPVTRIVRASTLDLISNKLVDSGDSPAPVQPTYDSALHHPTQTIRKTALTPRDHDPSVLFDADDFDGEAPPESDEEDDFGDFESVPAQTAPAVDLFSTHVDTLPVKQTVRPAPAARASDLLSGLNLLDEEEKQSVVKPKVSPSLQEHSPHPGLRVVTPNVTEFPPEVKQAESDPPTAWPAFDSWDGKPQDKKTDSFFDDWEPAQITTQKPPSDPRDPATELGWEWDAVDAPPPPAPPPTTEPIIGKRQTPRAVNQNGLNLLVDDVPGPKPQAMAQEETQLPPTNIPPPSIMLSLFPSLLDLASISLFNGLSNHSNTIRDRVLADPQAQKFLRSYLLLATVAGRVIAGRKLRWHRDKFLSQSMSISAAGGKGGMKLAGIDKTQAAREDREAADVLDLWARQVGKLRGAVAAVNAMLKDGGGGAAGLTQLKVPELSMMMAVQVVKGAETAPRACFLCGLKREERVAKVDFEVEDSFHEWWIDHWGHRACKNFWNEHEGALRQR